MTWFALLAGVLFACAIVVAVALALFTEYTARRVRAALPPTGHFVDVDGARIHYIEEGFGPTLLFVHGLGAQGQNFTHSVVQRLANDFRAVVMDRPGSGYSTRHPNQAAGIRAQARTVAAFIRALGLEQPVVVAHSLGGAIALALALDFPELVSGLVLIAPFTQPEQSPPAAFAPLAIESPLRRRLLAWTVAIPASILRGRAILETVFAPDPVPRDYATAGGGLLGLRPSSFYATSTDLVAAREDMPSIVARYGELRIPVGILFGRGDRLLDYRKHGERTAVEIPHARLELMEGGHMLPLTAPDRVASFVREIARRTQRER